MERRQTAATSPTVPAEELNQGRKFGAELFWHRLLEKAKGEPARHYLGLLERLIS